MPFDKVRFASQTQRRQGHTNKKQHRQNETNRFFQKANKVDGTNARQTKLVKVKQRELIGMPKFLYVLFKSVPKQKFDLCRTFYLFHIRSNVFIVRNSCFSFQCVIGTAHINHILTQFSIALEMVFNNLLHFIVKKRKTNV